MPTPTSNGGYVYPTSGSSGFIQQSQSLPWYQGASVISHIPDFQRRYNLRDGLITRIQEGRLNMMRVLLDYARRNGAFVVDDVQPRWYLEHQPINRFYLEVQNNQGGTKAATVNTGTFKLDSTDDAKRLQTGDYIALMFSHVPVARGAVSTNLDYNYDSAWQTIPMKDSDTPMPEVCLITDVNYTNGTVTVERNVAGDDRTTDYGGVGLEVIASTATPDAANEVLQRDAFFVKMGNSLPEGRVDQLVWSTSNTWDWNNCQFVGRKWAATDIQQNMFKEGVSEQNTFMRNKRLALESLLEELEWQFMFGFRKTENTSDGRWKGWFGGMVEYIPSGHFEDLQAPDYSSFSSKPGDFTIPNFNKKLEDKFYYGSQEKILVCGVDFHTAFSTMINYMTQDIPTIVDRWSVRGQMFNASNGGSVFVIPSDKLSLYGLSHAALLIDPSSFQYGHLQNMDLTVIDKLTSENPHEDTGEVFGVLTMKRTNPDANWMFTMQPNTE